MRLLNRFWSWSLKASPSKLLACLIFILVAVATERTVYGEVWVPAAAVTSDFSRQTEDFSRQTEDFLQHTEDFLQQTKKPRSRVMLVDYEGPASQDSDPGLIVPLEALGPAVQVSPAVQVGPSYTPGTMVPGSMRVLQASNPVMLTTSEPWQWQILPSGLLWHSYLAGPREPRISSTFFHVKGQQDYWDATLGGRVSLLRFGSSDRRSPEGVEIQLEGAAFPRLTLDYDRDLVASDYRFGFPLVYRRGPVEAKFSYYHLSSHLGDEYLISHPEMNAKRINYSRDAFTFALGYFPWRDLRLYGEVGYAIWAEGGSRPWEFQFGVDYSPASPTGIWGAPFAALNGHLHQELNYGGGFTAQAGIQWRGQTGRLLRFGFQYFNGMSEQYQFFRQFEQQLGGGIWYDF